MKPNNILCQVSEHQMERKYYFVSVGIQRDAVCFLGKYQMHESTHAISLLSQSVSFMKHE